MTGIWYDENDHALELIGLRNGITLAWVNNATVQATLYDSAGAELSGVAWPATLANVVSSNGDYRGIIDKALVVTPRDNITARVTAASGELDATWEEQIKVTKRRSL